MKIAVVLFVIGLCVSIFLSATSPQEPGFSAGSSVSPSPAPAAIGGGL